MISHLVDSYDFRREDNWIERHVEDYDLYFSIMERGIPENVIDKRIVVRNMEFTKGSPFIAVTRNLSCFRFPSDYFYDEQKNRVYHSTLICY